MTEAAPWARERALRLLTGDWSAVCCATAEEASLARITDLVVIYVTGTKEGERLCCRSLLCQAVHGEDMHDE